MPELLLLRLEGPLQSWGVRARWDVRDSAREPSKSGVVGLLGAALGYARDDPRLVEELDAGLEMGVRVEREPGLLDDYQTVTGFLPMGGGGFKASGQTARELARLVADPDAEPYTVQSTRRYLTDGSYLVALAVASGAPEGLLRRCADALRRPHWPLFLGRRACVPTRPVLEALTDEYDGVEDALRRHPWSCLGANGRPRAGGPDARLRLIVERPGGAPRDERRLDGATRLYGRRFVHESTIPAPPAPPEAPTGDDA